MARISRDFSRAMVCRLWADFALHGFCVSPKRPRLVLGCPGLKRCRCGRRSSHDGQLAFHID